MPTITVDVGAGTGATVTASGDDLQGVIELTSGALPTVNAVIFDFDFDRTMGKAPKILISPANAAAAILGLATAFVDPADTNTLGWKLKAPATAIPAMTTLSWYYQVFGL